MLEALEADALADDEGGAVLRVSLPWIRSLPIAALSGLEVQIDDVPVVAPQLRLGDRLVSLDDLVLETGWWFVQDRLVVRLDRRLEAGTHLVRLAFRLAIPYLQIGPDGPLTLPFLFQRELTVAPARPTAGVARDVA